jgi:hypothetical protein
MNQLRTNYSQPKEYYTNQMLRPRGGQDSQSMPLTAPMGSGQVQGSFDRMMNIGQVGGLGGRMGELEKASMRLGEAASQRRVGEMEREYGLKGGLLEKEISAKTAGIGAEAKASERASLESQMRALQSKGRLTPEEQDRLSQISRQLASIR